MVSVKAVVRKGIVKKLSRGIRSFAEGHLEQEAMIQLSLMRVLDVLVTHFTDERSSDPGVLAEAVQSMWKCDL